MTSTMIFHFEERENVVADLFDLVEGEKEKARGMSAASWSRSDLLAEAQTIACELAMAREMREVHADNVYREMKRRGIPFEGLGPAAGSIFKGRDWVFTGKRIKSARISNHARDIKVWRLG